MKTSIKLFFLFTIFFSLFSANAQVPEKMSYQAVIRNASNTLITNQPIGMRVSILQGSPTGTEVYKEIYNPNPQTNPNGLVTLEIGTGIILTGTFAGINWANGPYFIKIETDPTGGTNYTITGTSQLMSVPYALFAKNSGNTGWGLTGNSGTNSTSNFIGTTDNQDVVFKRNNIKAGAIGLSNTSYGLYALNANTTGSNNTANGDRALNSNTTGYDNTANGTQALFSNTLGTHNTANGVQTLNSNTTGVSNTALGVQALNNNTTGNFNTANGVQALKSNTTGSNNTANGESALEANTIGSNNTGIGTIALFNLTSGNNNTGLGYNAQVPSATASNQVRIGNTAVTYAGVQVAWTITSDQRWKENIQTSALGLNFINDLHPVSYSRKNDENKKTEYGFIAQELEKTLADFGVNNAGFITKDDEGMLSVRYNDLLAPMVKAIQELKAENDQLKAQNNWADAEIKNIKSSNEMLIKRLERLEQLIMLSANLK